MLAPLFRRPELALAPTRSAVDLLRQQHAALVEWERQRGLLPVLDPDASREEHLSAARIEEIYERERTALESRLEAAREELEVRTRPMALVAHRHDWVGAAICAGLRGRDWEVVDAFGDAAIAIACLAVHQPDLVVSSDRLLGGDGVAVVTRGGRLSPSTRFAVQLDEEGRLGQLTQAGAHLVVSHRTPTAQLIELVDGLRCPSGASGSDQAASSPA